MFSPETPTNITDEEVLKEQRKKHACPASQDILGFELLFKFPSWTKLRKIMTCCLRFVKNIKYPSKLITGFLPVLEREKATNAMMKLIQNHEFGKK